METWLIITLVVAAIFGLLLIGVFSLLAIGLKSYYQAMERDNTPSFKRKK